MDTEKGADPHHTYHAKWQIKKSDHLEDLAHIDDKLRTVKDAIKQQTRHILWTELDSSEQFNQLPVSRRTLINTLGMICYRAETAMATLLMETNATLPPSRALLQDLFTAPADLRPDYREKQLHIHLHTAATPKRNRQLVHLLTELNQTRTHYPGTDLEMTFHPPDFSSS